MERIYYRQNINQPTRAVFRQKIGQVWPKTSQGYRTNNPYVFEETRSQTSFGHPSIANMGNQIGVSDPWTSTGPSAGTVNKAIRKLEQKLQGESSQLMTAALEWNSSLKMVSARATQLWSAYRALRNWDLPRVARTLGFSPTSYARQRVDRMARLNRPTEAWLEYWMGWAPAVNDIYTAIDVLQRPYTRQHARATSSEVVHHRNGTMAQQGWVKTGRSEIKYALYCDVEVSNTNLLIANQLGLLNPAQTAWELVPFSFVIDWFTNVGQVLGNLNRFAGLRISNSGEATHIRHQIDLNGVAAGYDPNADPRFFDAYYSASLKSEKKRRSPRGLPYATLTLELPSLSLTRAATAVSLLTEIFLIKDKR